jgi:HEXXH motif-containing protein
LEPLSYDELIANQAAEKLHAAWQILASVPSVLASMQALVKTIQVVHSPDLEIDISYSHPDIPFSVFVSVGEDTSLISSLRVAESILHEAMHLQLTLLEAQLPLVQPDSQATFYSPWRMEARPVRGVLHGLYVFRVIHDFYESLPAPPLATEWAPFVANRLATIRKELAEITSFGTAAGLTDAGQHLVRSLLDVEAA